ncbi:hypothetical protein HDU93_007668 [Gonapodya sp. JEL0774]|nr:hypothetical protein HDU93_007668 [Gonapodya sp. JEL0774]
MTGTIPTVLINCPVYSSFIDAVRTRGVNVLGPFDNLLATIRTGSQKEREAIARASYMITFGTVGTPESLIEALPNLKGVTCFGSGYEGVDLEACRKRGILVAHSPDANSSCVADLCMGLILNVTRRLVSADRFIRTGVWNKSPSAASGITPGNMFAKVGTPRGLGQLKLGVLGLGAIGHKVALRGQAFEMEVGYHNRTKRADVNPEYKYFPAPVELARWCDVLAVCIRASPETRHIVNSELLTALGPDGFVVNISRGHAVDEKTLVRFLQEGKLAGAGLDVFEREPLVEPELMRMGIDESGAGPYLVLAPHVGGQTQRARDAYKAGTQMVAADYSDFNAWGCAKWFPSGIGSASPPPAAQRTCDTIYAAFKAGTQMSNQDYSDWSAWSCAKWFASGIGSPSSPPATPPPSPPATGGYSVVPGGLSGDAKTTRYWDCCKPSCGWSGNTGLGVGSRICSKSGNTLTDSNVMSGCGGGGSTGPEDGFSYTCIDNQPIVINDQLAYAFAAAPFSDMSSCCACYELTFTSGPVAGKKLVVQKVNTGGDLGSNQFDLQIPGGGLGIFDGCSKQFGVDANTWGARYGGVSSAAGCGVLPQSLQAGCNFRFGWFQGADNPSATFKQVTCPAELKAKSGCSR